MALGVGRVCVRVRGARGDEVGAITHYRQTEDQARKGKGRNCRLRGSGGRQIHAGIITLASAPIV